MSYHPHYIISRSTLILACTLSLVAARGTAAQESRSTSASVMLGGFAVGASRLALGKVEFAAGHWGLLVDVTRDATSERWGATSSRVASRGDYTLWAASASLRRYAGKEARGLFVENGLGLAHAGLEVAPASGARVRRNANIPMASWGAGGRIFPSTAPLFIELAVRGAIPLATRHLHSDATPLPGSTERFVTYNSWYFGRGKSTAQLYAGIGVSF